MRIGTNHGSLSDRIMNRYGDTPLGMVESALEFARIAREMDYHDFIFSMKASNPKVMIEAYRLLVARLGELGDKEAAAQQPSSRESVAAAVASSWAYPIHLGVTEAGDGEDGRIKSAIGIGSLLSDGIGDTVRVSLTEDSVHEIPVAQALVAPFNRVPRESSSVTAGANVALSYDPFQLPAARHGAHHGQRRGAGRRRNDARLHDTGEVERARAQDRPARRFQAGDRAGNIRRRGRRSARCGGASPG